MTSTSIGMTSVLVEVGRISVGMGGVSVEVGRVSVIVGRFEGGSGSVLPESSRFSISR